MPGMPAEPLDVFEFRGDALPSPPSTPTARGRRLTAQIDLGGRTRLLVLTGAGISVESGLAAFRGPGGLWERGDDRPEDVASLEGWERDPRQVWAFHATMRSASAAAVPNEAHRALVDCEGRLGERFLLVTQNIDGLHRQAGSRRVLELHGNLFRSRCADCDRPPFDDSSTPTEPPACDRCGGRLRPAVVWFGERVDPEADYRTKRFIKDAEGAHDRLVFLAVGTSGSVWPANSLVRYAADFGAETWLANLDAAENASRFDHVVTGPATAVVPALIGEAESP